MEGMELPSKFQHHGLLVVSGDLWRGSMGPPEVGDPPPGPNQFEIRPVPGCIVHYNLSADLLIVSATCPALRLLSREGLRHKKVQAHFTKDE